MAGFTKSVLTNKGRNLFTKTQTGVVISFTKVKLGSGQLANGQSIENLTDLINTVMNVSIQSVSYLGDGKTRIRVRLTNTGLVEGFFFREIGLYATDPSEGEILYCASNAGNQADFIPAEGSVAFEQVLDIITVVGNSNVTAVVQDTGAHVLVLDFQDHRTAGVLDHPDDSVTDNKIGNRTVVDTVAPASYTGKLTTLLSGIFYMLKSITGKPDGKTVPAMTLEDVNGKFGSTGHKHTGGVGDGPKIASTGLADNAATDTIIGNRLITDTTAAAAGADMVTGLFSKLGYMIKSITGKANWYTAPVTTLQALSDLIVSAAAAGKLLKLDASGKLPADVTGNAATATKLAVVKTISMTGDVTWSVSFDGSGNVTGMAVVSDDSHSHTAATLPTYLGTRLWTSGEFTPVTGAVTSATHNLGINPLNVRGEVLLKCVVADLGYSVGDITDAFASCSASDWVVHGTQVMTNTIQTSTGTMGLGLFIMRKDNGNYALPTALANWRYVFRIWY